MKSVIITKKLKQYYLFVFFSIIIVYPARSQSAHLPNPWKFKLGDNLEWASPSFDDSGWDNRQTGASWAAKDVKDNVYAWYRVKIIIPSSMKSAVENGKEIKLSLGKIDDVDQTFFNGKLVGQTGSLPPAYETKWDVKRDYIIPENEVQWDKENLIAVRVFSLDNGRIGMCQGPYSIGSVQWPDYISVQHSISETGNNGFTTKIKFTNNSNNSFDGTVNYSIKDKLRKKVYSETKPVEVKPVKGAETDLSFQEYKPVNEDIFKVSYWITENGTADTVKNEQVYLANKNVEIKVADEPKAVIEDKIKDAFTSIPFQNQILQGYIGERSSQNLEERLLKVDEDGIMSGYLQRPGSHPWIGEHVGKYLEAACNVWKNTHDPRLKKQMDRMMYELVNSQLKDGYLGTYSPENYWTIWDVWSYKYNLYGLLAYYTTTGYQPAFDACKRMGDLLCTTFGKKPGQRDIILAGESVGMAATSVLDPMIELYRYTGEKKYLDFCYYILEAWEQKNGPKIISSLLQTGQVNKVANGKAYEMLSNLLGLANLYRVTGDQKLLKPVLIAWQDIVTNRLYVTGTTSSFEHFQEDEVLPAANTDDIGEGCVTVTWIQLNQRLFAITGDSKFMEQIEKSIYNQLFGAENPESGCVSYYTPLMGKKPYSCGISCCTSSVPRGIALIPSSTFGNVNNIPTLLLHGPAFYKEYITTADKKDINLSVKIESSFPETGDETITINPSQTALFTFALRVPSWSSSFIAEVNRKEYLGTANHYLEIKRVWKSGDKIKVSFKIPVQVLDGGESYPGYIAIKYGTQVLAVDQALNPEIRDLDQLSVGSPELATLPKTTLPSGWIGDQIYKTNAFYDGKPVVINLVPYADASQTGGDIRVWIKKK